MNKPPRMLTTLKLSLLAAALAAGTVQAQTSSASQSTATQPAQPAASSNTAAAMSKDDQKMLEHLAQANMAEVKAGEMALQKTQNPQVKEFAQKMVDQHGPALKEVQQLASTKGVKLPDEVDTKHKVAMAALEKLDGEKFDRAYMRQGGVSDHKSTHKLVQNIQKKAKDQDLKALAAKLQPTIDQHLQTAQNMKDTKADQSSGSSQAGSTAGGK